MSENIEIQKRWGDLSPKLLLLQNVENVLTTFLHSTVDTFSTYLQSVDSWVGWSSLSRICNNIRVLHPNEYSWQIVSAASLIENDFYQVADVMYTEKRGL